MVFFKRKKEQQIKEQLVTDVVLFLFFFAAVLLFWQTGWLVTLIGIGIVLIGFFFFHTREDVLFFILAAVLGSLAESIVIHFGIWEYAEPVFLGLPLWAPLFWGFSFLFGRRVRDAIFKLSHIQIHYTHHKKVKSNTRFLLFDALVYILALLFVLGFWQSGVWLATLFIFLLLLLMTQYHNPEDIFFIAFAIVIGTFVEVTSVHVGVWAHMNDAFFGMPLWIPILYGVFALVVRRSAITINLLIKK